MKKMFTKLAAFILAMLIIVNFTSCIKEGSKKPFIVEVKTWYRVVPIPPEDIVVNNVTYKALAFFPGGGEGTATYMGAAHNYFNQKVYAASTEATPAGSVSAPAIDVTGYRVLGYPLPFIQATDFNSFAAAKNSLNFPAQVNGRIVNSIFYDDSGNAVYTSAIDGKGAVFPVSTTVAGFNGKALIVGGRGKFANATGEFDYNGTFNINNANDATYNGIGWIEY